MALLTMRALTRGPYAIRWADVTDGLSHLRRLLGPIVRVSLPTFGEKLIFHSGFLVFAALVGRLGETAMTANQSLIAIESVGFMTATGFGIASGALVAQSLGATDPVRAKAVGWTAAGLGAVCLGVVSVVFLAIPETIVRSFTDDPSVIGATASAHRRDRTAHHGRLRRAGWAADAGDPLSDGGGARAPWSCGLPPADPHRRAVVGTGESGSAPPRLDRANDLADHDLGPWAVARPRCGPSGQPRLSACMRPTRSCSSAGCSADHSG